MRTPDSWLTEQRIGKIGSPKRLYWLFKQFYGSRPSSAGLYECLNFITRLAEALDHDDLKFIDKLAKGAREFVKGDKKTLSQGLIYFPPEADEILSSQKEIPYNLQTRRRLAAELHVLSRDGYDPLLPISKLPESVQTRINQEVKNIVTEHRHEKLAGVPKAPPAPGGRPSTRRRKGQS